MPFRWNFQETLALSRYVLKWILVAGPVSAAVGSACALFLWLLERATEAQWNEPRLLFLLPVAGIVIAATYQWFGKDTEAGNNLIMDEIHDPGAGVPARMAPLILLSTVGTHLFGGSAGREGTAVQMGGSIADSVARWLRFNAVDRRTLLMTGIAAGFGGVFGTPVAGAIFAMEVIAMGRITHEAIVPCLVAAVIGDWSCAAWGVHHTNYHQVIQTIPAIDWILLAKVTLASVAFGLASQLFAELTHGLQKTFKRTIPWPLARPFIGGLCVIGLVYALGTRDYLGLGVHAPPGDPDGVSIMSSFRLGGADAFSWWWKILFTAVTLSSGFKGGEVTPLFFIGASLGNTLAMLLDAPVDLFAALGFVAVFAGATNTPIACTVMGIELFGGGHAIYFATACCLGYLFSGHSGIYLSQRIATPKVAALNLRTGLTLRERRDGLPPPRQPAGDPVNARVAGKASTDPDEGPVSPSMEEHRVSTEEIGQLSIYFTSGDKRAGSTLLGRLFPRPLYRDLIDAAQAEGLLNANAYDAQYGYSSRGKIQVPHAEVREPGLNMFVELVGSRQELEAFTVRHAQLLAGKTLVYKQLEHWQLESAGVVPSDAAPDDRGAKSLSSGDSERMR